MRVISGMRRIRQMLQPFRSVLSSRKLYNEYRNLLKTVWTCCPCKEIISSIDETFMKFDLLCMIAVSSLSIIKVNCQPSV
jgi:hypothetical protein